MHINDLVKKIKDTFGVEKVSEADLLKVKEIIVRKKTQGISNSQAVQDAIVEVFSKKPKQTNESRFLVKGWDLSWFSSNSSSLQQAIDQYFANKPK